MNSSIKNIIDIIMSDAKTVCGKMDLSALYGKKVIITGASGLLGVHFLACIKNLIKKGKDIETIAITRSTPPSYINTLIDYGNSRFVSGDLADSVFLRSLPSVDYIIHAAGYGQPMRFMENPINTIMLNTVGTIGLIEKLRTNGKFLFISTSELYSGLAASPYIESQIGTTNTDHHRACYIEAKRCGETICNSYRQKGLYAKSARLCLAYGPGIRTGDKRVINTFIEKALLEKEINMLDYGQAIRTYCYISDAVYMLWRILMEGKEHVYNVGGNSRISIAELANNIGRIVNVPVQMPDSGKAGVTGAPDDVCLDITKFEQEFHPMSFIPINEGLSRTVEWIRGIINCTNYRVNKGSRGCQSNGH